MNWGAYLKWTIVGCGIGAVVLALITTWGLLTHRLTVLERNRAPHALGLFSTAILVGLIIEAVARAPFVKTEWRAWLFLTGLVGFAYSMLWLGWRARAAHRKE